MVIHYLVDDEIQTNGYVYQIIANHPGRIIFVDCCGLLVDSWGIKNKYLK